MILNDLWRDCALRRSRMIRALSARELATHARTARRRTRVLCVRSFSDEEWRLVVGSLFSDL